MTLLGFKERFVPAVLAGYSERVDGPLPAGVTPKRHSIRAVGESGVCRFKVGDRLQLYRKVRQKGMAKIVEADPVVTKVERIQISNYRGQGHVIKEAEISFEPGTIPVDQNVATQLSREEVAALASSDGFDSANAFFDFFVPNVDDVFRGHIIHWDWQ